MVAIYRKYSTVAERAQALTLHAKGASYQHIEDKTGIKKSTFKAILRRAKGRGYEVGDAIKVAHVQDAPRPGRPRVIGIVTTAAIHAGTTKNSTTREHSSQQIADGAARRTVDSGSNSKLAINPAERMAELDVEVAQQEGEEEGEEKGDGWENEDEVEVQAGAT